jgi:serine/threonine protein kinase
MGNIDSGPYLALEYIEGSSLRGVIRKHALTEAQTVVLARDLARGLIHIHARRMLHNDIKPENVFMTPLGAKIIDFGLATSTGLFGMLLQKKRKVAGTPSYVAPERLLGQRPDERSDMYSAGATLYEAISQRTAVSGMSIPDILKRIASREPAEPLRKAAPGVTMAMAAIVDKCLKKDPDERFNNLHEFLLALRRHPMYDTSAVAEGE